MRILPVGGFLVAALLSGGSVAQEESCVSALESRMTAAERVLATMPSLDVPCSELKERLDAFIAAEAALGKAYRAVKRACPAGEFVRGDWHDSARSQMIVETAQRRLARCGELRSK